MNGEGEPEEPHGEKAGVPVPHSTTPWGLISAIADEQQCWDRGLGGYHGSQLQGLPPSYLLVPFKLHLLGHTHTHTHLAPLGSVARLRMYFPQRQILTMCTPPGCSHFTLLTTIKERRGCGLSPFG